MDRFPRIPALGGLQASPIHGDADDVQAELAAKVEIAARLAPPIAGVTVAVTRADASLSFPRGPLIVGVLSFELVGAGGHAPLEAGGKLQHCYQY
jgi:uncharacterized membrane protein